MRRTAVLTAAVALDLAFGEPPATVHPVVWLGRLVSALEKRVPRGEARKELVGGTAVTVACVAVAWACGRLAVLGVDVLSGRRAWAGLVGRASVHAPRARGGHGGPPHRALGLPHRVLGFLAEAWLVKTTLSIRALFEAAREVQESLERGDFAAAREASRRLVSRDTEGLCGSLLASAAIESVAENASDSAVAPAAAYLAFGLPGAFAYRAINTLDAMLGYRGELEWLGKAAARLDDLANLLPARLTAALLVVAAAFAHYFDQLRAGASIDPEQAVGRSSARAAWSAAWADHQKTASPNAGWPMSALAGALGVELEKVGHHRLGSPGRRPAASDIHKSVGVAATALAMGFLAVVVVQGARRAAVDGTLWPER